MFWGCVNFRVVKYVLLFLWMNPLICLIRCWCWFFLLANMMKVIFKVILSSFWLLSRIRSYHPLFIERFEFIRFREDNTYPECLKLALLQWTSLIHVPLKVHTKLYFWYCWHLHMKVDWDFKIYTKIKIPTFPVLQALILNKYFLDEERQNIWICSSCL